MSLFYIGCHHEHKINLAKNRLVVVFRSVPFRSVLFCSVPHQTKKEHLRVEFYRFENAKIAKPNWGEIGARKEKKPTTRRTA